MNNKPAYSAYDNNLFCQRLNDACDDAGIPALNYGRQIAVKNALKVSQETARRWLSGEMKPRLSRIKELATWLKCSTSWLAFGEGSEKEYSHMQSMDNKEIRKLNLSRLVKEAGTIARLSEIIDTNPAYLSQILTGQTYKSGAIRGVGDALARKLEKGMGKPHGWMDTCYDQINDGDLNISRPVAWIPVTPLDSALAFKDLLDAHQANKNNEDSLIKAIPMPADALEQNKTYFAINTDDIPGSTLPPGSYLLLTPDQEPQPTNFVLCEIKSKAEIREYRRQKADVYELVCLNEAYGRDSFDDPERKNMRAVAVKKIIFEDLV